MKRIISDLRLLGFSHTEALVWRSILELGEADITTLARHGGVPRTTVYTVVEKLRDKGLVDFYIKKKRSMYVAVPPERLVKFFSEKEEIAKNLLPELQTLRKHERMPHIIVHHGVEGVRLIFEHIIQKKMPISAITSLEDMQEVARKPFAKFIENRIDRKLPIRFITNNSPDALQLASRDTEALRETRFVPDNFKFHTANYIFNDHVALLSLRQHIPIGVLIHDKDIASTFQMYFDLLWSFAAKSASEYR